MKRGFTIVELTVVIAVIGILLTIGVAAYNKFQDRAGDAQAEAMVSVLSSALESYYNKNNEYPTAEQLFGGVPNGSVPASYSTAANLLDLKTSVFTSKYAKFMPCSAAGGYPVSNCTYSDYNGWVQGTQYVKYITKATGEEMTDKSYVVASPNGPGTTTAGCELVLRPTIHPNSVYVLTYWSREESKIKFVKSRNGEVRHYSAEAGQCVFTTP